MKKLFIVLLIVTVTLAVGCAEELPKPIEHDTEIIEELNYILDFVENETVQQTIRMVTEAPVEINKDYLEVNLIEDSRDIYNVEAAPFKNHKYMFSDESVELGNYYRYSCAYNEEHKNGSVELIYLTIFIEADEEKVPLIPLHIYAYNRTLEKPTGILEPFTPLKWFNSFIQVGGQETTEEFEIEWIPVEKDN